MKPSKTFFCLATFLFLSAYDSPGDQSNEPLPIEKVISKDINVGDLLDANKQNLTDSICHYDIKYTEGNAEDLWISPSGTIFLAKPTDVLKYEGGKRCQYRFDIPGMADCCGTACIIKDSAIYGFSDDFVVYVHNGYIFQYDGKVWHLISSKLNRAYYDVWISSKKEIFIVGAAEGDGITIVLKDGVATEKKHYLYVYAVWGGSDDQVFAAGEDVAIYRFTGSDWENIDTSTTKWLRKKYCPRYENGGMKPGYDYGLCSLGHIAGNPEHGYYVSTCDSMEGQDGYMLRYNNNKGKVTLFKKDVFGPMWMDPDGLVHGYAGGTKFLLYKLKGKKFYYNYKYQRAHVLSIRGLDKNNIYSVSKDNLALAKYDGKKWFSYFP